MLFDDSSDFILEQDHASVHDSHETQEWLLHQGINFISSEDSPPKLDDLWPIERVWAVMTQQVYAFLPPENLSELRIRIENAWKGFNPKTLKKLVHEIPFRIKAIIKNEGERIPRPLGHCLCDICAS